MTGPTTVRELLDMAVEQLDSLSRDQISAAPPSARSIAEAWPGFAAAAWQLMSVSVAFHNPHDRVQRAAASAATGGPCGPSAGAGEPRLARAADLIGAAADLVEPQARMVAAADRRAACVDAARAYLLGAQVTVHATMHDLRLLNTAAAAAIAARDAGKVASGDTELASDGRLAHVSTWRRPQPVAGDLLGLFDQAVFDWRAAALQAARRPDVSSEDLRGAALGAGRIVALTQVLHRAHWAGHLTEDEARRMDSEFTRVGHAVAAVATHWTPFSTGTKPSPDLIQASSGLQRAITLLACNGPHWAPHEELRQRADLLLALKGGQLAIDNLGDVIRQDAEVARSMAHHGRLFHRSMQREDSSQAVNVLRKGRWVTASDRNTSGLSHAYLRLVNTLADRATHTIPASHTRAVATPHVFMSRADALTPGPARFGR